MHTELEYFLTEGPRTVKDLARLTQLSTSTIYKQLKDERVKSQDAASGKVFWIGDAGEQAAPESTVAPAEAPDNAPAPPTAVLKGKETRGRKPTAAGKKIYPALISNDDGAGTYLNPRRVTSHGYRSLQIVIDNPGITQEEYLTKGGRLNDLRWDIARGNVRVED